MRSADSGDSNKRRGRGRKGPGMVCNRQNTHGDTFDMGRSIRLDYGRASFFTELDLELECLSHLDLYLPYRLYLNYVLFDLYATKWNSINYVS